MAKIHIFKPMSMRGKAVVPNKPSTGASGRGSFLLDNGMGGQASYDNMDQYIDTTNNRFKGKGLGDKLGKLLIKPPVPKKRGAIKFEM